MRKSEPATDVVLLFLMLVFLLAIWTFFVPFEIIREMARERKFKSCYSKHLELFDCGDKGGDKGCFLECAYRVDQRWMHEMVKKAIAGNKEAAMTIRWYECYD